MATSTSLAAPATIPSVQSAFPFAQTPGRNLLIYWHLCSFDAPTVAMLWTWFIAKSSGIVLPKSAILAMGAAVWLLYAADRLLDSRLPSRNCHSIGALNIQPMASLAGARSLAGLEPRHLFHQRNRRFFATGIFVATLTLGCLIPTLAPQSIHLYGILGTLLIAYFALIHLPRNPTPRLPKEIAVGMFFSAATFIPTVARNANLRSQLLPTALFFGLTCSLNCLYIYTWEHRTPFPEAHPLTRLALRLLRPLSFFAIFGDTFLMLTGEHWQLACAILLASLLLLLLHKKRNLFDPTTLRAAADLCLLTPIFFAAIVLS